MATKVIASTDGYVESVTTIMKKQLYAGGAIKVFSWGAKNWSWGVLDGSKEPTLVFEVNGHHFQGEVRVIYDPMDYYRVELVDKGSGEVKDTLNEVYADELTDLIDVKVERIDSYVI